MIPCYTDKVRECQALGCFHPAGGSQWHSMVHGILGAQVWNATARPLFSSLKKTGTKPMAPINAGNSEAWLQGDKMQEAVGDSWALCKAERAYPWSSYWGQTASGAWRHSRAMWNLCHFKMNPVCGPYTRLEVCKTFSEGRRIGMAILREKVLLTKPGRLTVVIFKGQSTVSLSPHKVQEAPW